VKPEGFNYDNKQQKKGKNKMKKVMMGFAVLFGTLAIFALVNQPNINDPEFWKGSHNQVFAIRPTGPQPVPTPAEQYAMAVFRVPRPEGPGPQPTPIEERIVAELVPTQVNGKQIETTLVLRVEETKPLEFGGGKLVQVRK
jgi:hypothetical protein